MGALEERTSQFVNVARSSQALHKAQSMHLRKSGPANLLSDADPFLKRQQSFEQIQVQISDIKSGQSKENESRTNSIKKRKTSSSGSKSKPKSGLGIEKQTSARFL